MATIKLNKEKYEQNLDMNFLAAIIKEKPENLFAPQRMWWKTGTRSSTTRFINKRTNESYLVKKVPFQYTEDVWIERAASTVFQSHDDTKEIFCKFLGYGYSYNQRAHLLVFDIENSYTLQKKFEDKNDINLVEIYPSLGQIGLLHNNAWKYLPEINKALRELSKGRLSKLEMLSTDRYMKKKLKYADQENKLSAKEKNFFKGAYSELAERYFVNPSLRSIMQHDGYPNNVTSDSSKPRLIDKGDLKVGSRALHLGLAYGHPVIFNKAKDKMEFVSEISNQYAIHAMHDTSKKEEIQNGILLGGSYGNYRLTYKGFFSHSEKAEFRKTGLEQMELLSGRDSAAKTVLNILRSL